MGDSEIVKFLKACKVVGLEISLLEDISDISESLGKEVTYDLKYATIRPNFDQKELLYLVSPDKVGNGHPIHAQYNLNALKQEGIEAHLPAGEQLKVMDIALEKIAAIDPRIKGIEAEPLAVIEKIGGRQYNLKFMQDMYSFIQKELKDSR